MKVKRLHEIHRQNIPKLFLEIMRHDVTEPAVPVASNGVDVISFDDWRKWKTKHDVWWTRKKQLIAAAEKALRWNTDKGNTA